jgi:hypothetical protein
MRLLLAVALFAALSVQADNWVEVGADPEAKFFVDLDSITVGKDSVSVRKRGVYNHTLTENFGGKPTVFRQTIGVIEMDCRLRVNRVLQIDMLDDAGEVVWSSGYMPKRMWEEVKPNSHAEATLDAVCARFSRT